jgi:transposase
MENSSQIIRKRTVFPGNTEFAQLIKIYLMEVPMKRRQFSPEEKMNIILESLQGERPISEICREHGITQSLYYQWRDKFMDGAKANLTHGRKKHNGEHVEVQQLKSIIAELTVENQILKKTQKLINRTLK